MLFRETHARTMQQRGDSLKKDEGVVFAVCFRDSFGAI
jgi:hypothetical protein